MGAATWITCPRGTWSRVFQGPAPWGFVYLWSASPPANVSYREYSAGLPFYYAGSLTVQMKTTVVVGPSPYVEIWVNPAATGNFRVT